MRCWFIDVEFVSGAMGHLDLTVAVRMDWHEGFQIYGEKGSAIGRSSIPGITAPARSTSSVRRMAQHIAFWGPTGTSIAGSWKALLMSFSRARR